MQTPFSKSLVLIKKNILRNTLRREYNTVISVNSYARPNIFQLSLRIGLQILKLKCHEKLSMTLAHKRHRKSRCSI